MKYVFAVIGSVVLSSVVGCGAPTASESQGSTDSQLRRSGGAVLSADQVAQFVRQAGFPEDMVGKMVCTAKYESSFDPGASNGSHFGLFQIARAHLGESGCPSSVAELNDPATNCACAFAVFQAQGMGAWTAYTSHRSECDSFQVAGGTGTGDGSGDPTQLADNSGGTGCQGPGGAMVAELTCAQANDQGFYQCHQGQWFPAQDQTTGPFGQCASGDGSGMGQDDGNLGFASYKY